MNPGRIPVYVLPPTRELIDQSKWDLYLIIFPFTLHQPPQNSYYEEVTFFVELTTPNATAFDLFPRNITTAGEDKKTYALSPLGYVEEISGDLPQASKSLRFEKLQPVITSFGAGESIFYWTFTGFGSRKEVIPETKHVLAILQVPHGTKVVSGIIRFEIVLARKLLGTRRHGQATTDEYPIQLELSEKPSFSGSGAQEAPNEEKSVSASSDVTASQLNGENILLGEISLQTFRIRITETPLTAHNLGTIVSTLAELSTKCWLIRQGRFAELMEYTQTHDSRFAEEVPVVITKVTFNSPMNMDWKVELSATNVADALVTAIDGITHAKKRLEKAELENQAKAQEVKQAVQKAGQEHQMALLAAEEQRLEIEERRLALLEKRLEVQKKEIEYALELAGKMVDTLYPNVGQEAKPILIQALLPNLLQLGNVKGLELNSPISPDSFSIQG